MLSPTQTQMVIITTRRRAQASVALRSAGGEAHVALTKSGRPQMLLLDPLARSSGNAEAAGRWMRKRNHAGKKRNPAESARARARDSQGRQRRPGSRERCRVATERRRRARPLARFQTSSSRGACLAAGFLRA
jgi:hypothetical protein